MQHSHHIDEFSVSDLRHTLGEAWRVVRDRRWCFLLPFLGVSSIALIGSLWLPRQWTVSTVIRREHDPVLASMVGKSWTEPYTEIRQRMSGELTDPQSIQKVIRALKLPEHGDQYREGELTPEAATAESSMISDVAAGLAIKNIETSATRDVVSIRLTMNDARHVSEILRALRDDYIARTQRRTTEILRAAEGFLQAESTRCRTEVTDLQKQIFELEAAHPGINPESTDPTQAAESSLVVEGVQLGRKLDELREDEKHLEEDRARETLREKGAPVSEANAGTVPLPSGPANPRYTALAQEMEKIQREIVEGRTIKMMTDQHPTIQRLYAALEAKQNELDQTPATMEQAAGAGLAPLDRIAMKQAELDTARSAIEKKLAANKSQIAKIEQGRAGMLQARDSFIKLKDKLARSNEELAGWQQHMGPIKHILTLEDSNRGIHFATVRDVDGTVRPASPDGRVVVGLCFAIGAAFGAIVVLLTELLDRSFRTAHGLSSTLGIPVIESIDEILTAAARRKRVMRRVFLLPATAMVLSLVMLMAGTMAYLSLESPADYEMVRHSPHRVFGMLWNSQG